jgi:hypothetical protein
MSYRHLPENLRPTAEATKAFFKAEKGLTSWRIEESIDAEIEFRPTMHSEARDGELVCVEVLERPYSSTLDSPVFECMKRCLPVRLYVAFPEDLDQSDYKGDLGRGGANGVGVIEVSSTAVKLIREAISLSLLGVRRVDKAAFPAKYRSELGESEATFRAGSPAKGCSILYDEIEALSRAIAIKTQTRGLWRPLRKGEKAPKVDLENGGWARVMEVLIEHLDYKKCKYLPKSLLARVLGITGHRNDTGHKPKSRAQLVKRNRELRTRFENAADLLLDIIVASKPLHV